MFNYFPNQYQSQLQPLMPLPSKPRTELKYGVKYGKEVDKKPNGLIGIPALNNSIMNNNQMQNSYNQQQRAGFGINNNPYSIMNSTNTMFNLPLMRYRGII